MSESSPANQALIAYVIGIILLLAFSMLIGMMIKGESEKQALVLLNPETIASQVLNTGDSELCKKTWRGRFCPPVSMPLSHPDLQWTTLCPSNPRDVKSRYWLLPVHPVGLWGWSVLSDRGCGLIRCVHLLAVMRSGSETWSELF